MLELEVQGDEVRCVAHLEEGGELLQARGGLEDEGEVEEGAGVGFVVM